MGTQGGSLNSPSWVAGSNSLFIGIQDSLVIDMEYCMRTDVTLENLTTNFALQGRHRVCKMPNMGENRTSIAFDRERRNRSLKAKEFQYACTFPSLMKKIVNLSLQLERNI